MIADILREDHGPYVVAAFDCEAEIKGRNGDVYLSIVVCGGEDHRLGVPVCTDAAAELARVAMSMPSPRFTGVRAALRDAVNVARADAQHPLAGVAKGGRDKALFHYLRTLYGKNLTAEEARLLGQIFAANCRPPLPPAQVDQKIERLWVEQRRAA